MEYRRVGNSGLKVSEIAYGSWLTFANQVELEHAQEIIRKAFELGVNYIDTADVYARGEAEKLLGQILPKYNRRHYVIATKAFWPMSDHPTDRGLSRKHITDSIQGSLDRLKLKYVDIFYCHRFDEETPLMETLEAIEDSIRQGKILYWGTSEWKAEQIRAAVNICRERGWHLPVINQPIYNLLNRNLEIDILPTTVELGMGTANFSPLAQGLLTGKYSKGKVPPGSRGSNENLNMFMKDQLEDENLLKKIDGLGEVADRYDMNIAQLSLAWILQQPGISSVITGASSVQQLEDNVKASGVNISETDMKAIDALFPRS
ncbi:aldo/keto reductase family protein [Salinispira pacifica]|uniref:Potassium channel beta chain n=1 Tax=Salinispira pacifica TaxID=1307761 RepID=V5WNU1_9SPIO|nr:aldo/keto reductase family protein [Salinispira pacifica]AHC16801.1 Potassium channel beta chain [Salinispira pacifica]